MAEVKTVVTLKRTQEIVWQIVEHFHLQKIILFGSHAYGTPTADSDICWSRWIRKKSLSMSQRELPQLLIIPFLWTLSYPRPPTRMLLWHAKGSLPQR
jgi:predicted nucleotidyltransferase